MYRVFIYVFVHIYPLNSEYKSDLGMQVKPCNGESPVMDPTTGQEFDCGNGPQRQDCPSNSYCHQTQHFAKCCRKGIFIEIHSY